MATVKKYSLLHRCVIHHLDQHQLPRCERNEGKAERKGGREEDDEDKMVSNTPKLKVAILSQLSSTVNGDRDISPKDCASHLVTFPLYTITQKHRVV